MDRTVAQKSDDLIQALLLQVDLSQVLKVTSMHVIHEVAQRLSRERATKGITNQEKKIKRTFKKSSAGVDMIRACVALLSQIRKLKKEEAQEPLVSFVRRGSERVSMHDQMDLVVIKNDTENKY